MAEDVVDGQQRLTTLMILLCVIKQVFPYINKKVDATQNPNVVKIRKIESCISTSNDINRLRLQSDPTQASNFEELIFVEDVEFSKYKGFDISKDFFEKNALSDIIGTVGI